MLACVILQPKRGINMISNTVRKSCKITQNLTLYVVIVCFTLWFFLRLLASRRKKNYWGFSINCTGNEADLSDCKLGREIEKKGNSTCGKGMPVVVSCVPGRVFAPSVSIGFRKAYRVEVSQIKHTIQSLRFKSQHSFLMCVWCILHYLLF